jgi:hypothetical protein
LLRKVSFSFRSLDFFSPIWFASQSFFFISVVQLVSPIWFASQSFFFISVVQLVSPIWFGVAKFRFHFNEIKIRERATREIRERATREIKIVKWKPLCKVASKQRNEEMESKM